MLRRRGAERVKRYGLPVLYREGMLKGRAWPQPEAAVLRRGGSRSA